MSWDTQLFFALNSLAGRTPFQDGLIVAVASYLPYLLVGGFALYLLVQRTWSTKQKAFAFCSAIAAALIARIGIGSPIRYFFPRPRPFLTYAVHQLIPEHAPSFPSGHALFFFAFSTAAYFMDKRLGILFYVLTVFICLARVAAGIHYPSDIIAGAVLGTLCGWAVLRYIAPHVERSNWWRKVTI
ncbi:MAG TPA: phosphatase PAP2 family protein [Candidatus Paceibacterota bacterium]|jgi:undecaprenyl-diphosphatase|nr:phosphatase PAP2 family protein [Candidatus Paceibacterota bacterium]